MGYQLENKLVVGVSARALFDLSEADDIYRKKGAEAYVAYQMAHETDIPQKGPGFGLIKALLELNKLPVGKERVEVILISRNSPDISLRIFHAISHYGLDITRAVMTSGKPVAPYLDAFRPDLFLSVCEEDVQYAIDTGIPAGVITMEGAAAGFQGEETTQVKIAFDADAVLFTEDSEILFQDKGLEAFERYEAKNARNPLPEGPFAHLLKVLSRMQQEFSPQASPIRTALVTARSAPAHERVIRTLSAWNVRIDEAFFLGGIDKQAILKAFGAHIFFDDQLVHTTAAAKVVPAARVPWKSGTKTVVPSGRLERKQVGKQVINEV